MHLSFNIKELPSYLFILIFSKLHQNIDQEQVDMMFNSEENFDSRPNGQHHDSILSFCRQITKMQS